jgi:hypothetical protein
VRAALSRRGTRAVFGLRRRLSLADSRGTGELEADALASVLHNERLGVTDGEICSLVRARQGEHVNYAEFVASIRPELNSVRRSIVLQAFAALDQRVRNRLSPDELRAMFDPTMHPDVANIPPRKTADEVVLEFLDTFEFEQSIDRDAFLEYYTDVSAGSPSDAHFKQLIRSAWRLDNDRRRFDEQAVTEALEYAHAPIPHDTVTPLRRGPSAAWRNCESDPDVFSPPARPSHAAVILPADSAPPTPVSAGGDNYQPTDRYMPPRNLPGQAGHAAAFAKQQLFPELPALPAASAELLERVRRLVIRSHAAAPSPSPTARLHRP